MENLRQRLEDLYNSFDFERFIQNDPIKFPKRFQSQADIEVSALISACFAYGNIRSFSYFLEELFKVIGRHPADFILNFNPSQLIKKLQIKYRFSSSQDIVAFLFILKNILKEKNSLEFLFNNKSIVDGISSFIGEAMKVDLSKIYGKDIKTRGLLHFFPTPKRGSPCKRINLFLRWMVRNADIDFGLWKSIKPSELIIPLDIHIWKVSKKLGLTKRKSQSLKTAIEITNSLKEIEPSDPLKYDFVLCHGDLNSLL